MEIRILGPVEAASGARRLRIAAPKEQALLALLALSHRRDVSTGTMIDELWPDGPPAQAASALHGYVSRLRRVLGQDAIRTTSGGYALTVPPESCDAVRFERLVGDGRERRRDGDQTAAAAILREALELWRGPAFGGLSGPRLDAERVRLEELRLSALEDRLEAEIESGRTADVVPELDALTREHPFRERLWHARITALYRCGRQSDALAAYGAVRDLLLDELGVDPGPELQALERAILTHTVGERSVNHASHSRDAGAFVGRAAERREVHDLLGRHRLVTIAGLGGSGKTTLARVIASERRHDTLAVVELGGVHDDALVAPAVASALGLREAPGLSLTDALANHLTERTGLLVLDECERVAGGVRDMATALLDDRPGLTILAISRQPLAAQDETVWHIPPLAPGEAATLFRRRADISRGEPAVAEICATLGGHPLAIEVAAAWTRVLSAEQIRQRLDDALRLLAGEDESRLVARAIEWSVGELTPAQRVLFRRLSVFAGGCTIDDVEVVCAGDGLDRQDVLPGLARLASLSLITVGGGDARRYAQLEPVRQLGARLADDAGETVGLRRRHLARLIDAVPALSPDEIDESIANIRAGLSWSIDGRGDPHGGLRLVARLAAYWSLRGFATEASRWAVSALDAASPGDDDADGLGATVLASSMAAVRGSLAECESFAHEALRRTGVRPDDTASAGALGNLAAAAHMRGDVRSAARYSREALDAARRAGSAELVGRVLNNAAVFARRAGNLDEAEALYEEALPGMTAGENPMVAVAAMVNLADLRRVRGDLARAKQICDEALALARARGFARGEAMCLGTLGNLAVDAGDLAEAHRRFEESIAVARATDDMPVLGTSLANLATVAEQRGEISAASTAYHEQLRIARSVGDRRGECDALVRLAGLLAQQDRSRAASYLRDAVPIVQDLKDPERVADCIDTVAVVLASRGDTEGASLALASADRMRSEVGLARSARDAARIQKVGDSVGGSAEGQEPEQALTALARRLDQR